VKNSQRAMFSSINCIQYCSLLSYAFYIYVCRMQLGFFPMANFSVHKSEIFVEIRRRPHYSSDLITGFFSHKNSPVHWIILYWKSLLFFFVREIDMQVKYPSKSKDAYSFKQLSNMINSLVVYSIEFSILIPYNKSGIDLWFETTVLLVEFEIRSIQK
jgi:hypothetical protein